MILQRAPATRTVPGPARAVLLVVEGFWVWYRRNWRSSVVSSVVQPVLFLLALGFGFGSQVEAGEATGGLRYVVYLAPALLVVTAVQLAAFEASYPVLGGFKWQSQYVAIAATPVTAGQIAAGQLAWIGLRIASSCLAYLAVAALLGAVTGPGMVLSVLVAVLTGLAAAAPIAAYSATLDSEITFTGLFRFVVLPMTLLAGAFFPVGVLPVWLRPVAWLTPMWHGTEAARGAAFGGLGFWAAAGHLAYLAALLALGMWLAARNFRRRLAK